ncbi:putative transcription factor C2H2 family [Helianthus annuus]|nr:putative transcription factor C2H2 family [Helianthus annuus]KAJ0608668.1 putative transcription factor C2H2 family [Helianthus annuus]KAJ0936454.1 putative transcription factor C2H2 family [Helianthus annuus]
MEKMITDEWDDEDDRNMMIGSSSSDGKMVIKLKIPKLSDEAVTEDEESPVIGKRVCVECKKEFSSGKALGGHMRIHVAQSGNKNPSFLKLSKPTKLFKKTGYQNQNQKPYYMNSVNEEGEPTCSLCGKTFPSMKSLFGHMRCHPERLWRGILPPQNTTTTTTAVHRRGGGGEVVDLMKCLPGWTVRERRGRKAVKAVVHDHDHDDVDGDDDEVLLGAVEDLLSLANGGGSMAESTNKIDENSPSVGKGKAVVMEEDEADNESDVNKYTNEQLLVKYKKIKKRKKMKLMMELQQQQVQEEEEQEGVISVSECKYKCTTCNKCFATHQALGGHRSSHNKSKLTSADHDDESFVMMVESGENLEKGLHHCKICNKGFATGQALGGHKRCHWVGTNELEVQAQALSSQITSAGEAASQTGSGKKVLDFDLNEVPEEEESANGYGYGYGYASSSYNSNMG